MNKMIWYGIGYGILALISLFGTCWMFRDAVKKGNEDAGLDLGLGCICFVGLMASGIATWWHLGEGMFP